jgi:ABC-2 type transport system ATP-binding protein
VEMHREIGFLPEQPYFYDYLTAREFLNYSARFFRMSRAERGARVIEFLERVGLTGAADVQLRKFSKGMLQRVGIAQAILHDPPVVFLDEPTSGLDPLGRREVRDIILDLKKRGRTVFFSTHILPDAEVLCDRVAVLAGGKLQGMGTPREIMSIEVQGMEIDFELTSGTRAAALAGGVTMVSSSVLASAKLVGSAYRLVVPEAGLYAALEALREARARIISVTQIKPSLEDYFFRLAANSDPKARKISHAIEVSGK